MMSISQHQNSLINMMSLLSFRNNRRIKQPEIMSTNDENTERHITSIASQNKDYNENNSCKPISTINVPKTPVSLLQVLYCLFNLKVSLASKIQNYNILTFNQVVPLTMQTIHKSIHLLGAICPARNNSKI